MVWCRPDTLSILPCSLSVVILFPVFHLISVWSCFFCFFFRLLCFLFHVSALLRCGLCHFLFVLYPPCTACEPACLRIPIVCCLRSFLILFLIYIYIFFFSLPSHSFISIWTSFTLSCLVHVGILLMLSLRFKLLLCVFFTLNPSFHPSTSSSPIVRADSFS